MIYDPDVETRAPQDQYRIDREQYSKQLEYLFAHSTFYRKRLAAAGFHKAADLGSLEDLEQLLRFRSRDHVVVNMQSNPTGRTGPRIRCIGRTDDMLIVRGVNLYPTAIRGILRDFTPDVGEIFRIRPRVRGVSQPIPLPIVVELGPDVASEPPGLRERLTAQIKTRLLITADVQLVPHGTLPRDTYKAKLVEYPEGAGLQSRTA